MHCCRMVLMFKVYVAQKFMVLMVVALHGGLEAYA